MFKYGDKVEKESGYRFPGVIVSVFDTLEGNERYVVQCTANEVNGCLHIFNEKQLRFRYD